MDIENTNEIENSESDVELNEKEGTSRREFFERFGKFALYTPPAVMVLMSDQTETAFGSDFIITDPRDECPSPSNGSEIPRTRLQRSERRASRLQKPKETK